MLAVYTGGRLSEINNLRWEEHVNLEKGWVRLPGTKTPSSRRVIPLAKPLRAYLGTLPDEHRGYVAEPWPNVRRDLALACERAGIARVSPNDLRRTFASWLKQAGVDSMTVARLLGHTTSRMVELVYGQLNNKTLVKAVKVLPKIELPALPAPQESGDKWVTASSTVRAKRANRAKPDWDRGGEESLAVPLPHHRTCGSASGGSRG
jgi:integrase